MNRRKCCISLLLVVGVVLLAVGIVFIPESQTIFHSQISQQITLNNTDTYDRWVTNSTPILYQIYIWDLTNPVETANGAKPAMAERGPYTYWESRQKVPVIYNDNNDTVSYREIQTFYFDRDMSVGPESDTFTTINIPMMVAANIMQKEFAGIQEAIDSLLQCGDEKLFKELTVAANIVQKEFAGIQEAIDALLQWGDEELFIQLTVRDVLWGYVDPLLNKTLNILKELGLKTKLLPIFGLFQNNNGTDLGLLNIKTGVGDISLLGETEAWNYMTHLPFWKSDTCNMINGTDATLFHPFVKKSDILYIFASDLCRSWYLQFVEETTREGIDIYRFIVPDSVFMNFTLNPANRGFCTTDVEDCQHSGLLNIECCRDDVLVKKCGCVSGAPIVISQPHFLAADQEVLDSVFGIYPDPAQHSTIIDVEPMTGQAFAAFKRIQINIKIEKVDHIKQTHNLQKLALPVIWLNESSVITPSLAEYFKSHVRTPMRVVQDGTWVAVGLGSALLCGTSLYILLHKILATRSKGDNYQSLQ